MRQLESTRLITCVAVALVCALAGHAHAQAPRRPSALQVHPDDGRAARGPRSARTVELFGAVSYVTNVRDSGVALSLGVRGAVGEHLALSFDVGYGILGTTRDLQDRWWLIPSIAYVANIDDVRIDAGLGVGLGATSGLGDLDNFLRGLFSPVWAFQLVPTVRAHVMASLAVARSCDVFVRIDAATLIGENDVGLHQGNPRPELDQLIWVTASLGASFPAP